MELIGKSYEEIESALNGVPRSRLVRVIQELASIEPSFLPEQVARALQIPRDAVIRAIKERRLRAEMPMTNRWRIPRSGLAEFRGSIAMRPNEENGQ
jgi:excisionase family DNA binding protein